MNRSEVFHVLETGRCPLHRGTQHNPTYPCFCCCSLRSPFSKRLHIFRFLANQICNSIIFGNGFNDNSKYFFFCLLGLSLLLVWPLCFSLASMLVNDQAIDFTPHSFLSFIFILRYLISFAYAQCDESQSHNSVHKINL